jgi:hypothetical protein
VEQAKEKTNIKDKKISRRFIGVILSWQFI